MLFQLVKIETNLRQLHQRMGCEGLVVALPYAVGNQRSVARVRSDCASSTD
jgi:hypothetical protein